VVFLVIGDTDIIRTSMDTLEKNKIDVMPTTFMEKAKQYLSAERLTQEQIKEAMLFYIEKYNYFLDPHSAIAGHVLMSRVEKSEEQGNFVTLCTAAPAKFYETVEKVTNKKFVLPATYVTLLQQKRRCL